MQFARLCGSAHPRHLPRFARWGGTHVNGASEAVPLINVHFVDPNGYKPQRTSVQAPVGSSIVDVAKAHGIDIHAACGQKLSCATCHVILKQHHYDELHPPGPRESDMLDSLFTIEDTSRLGCQVRLTPALDGIECTLPDKRHRGSVRMRPEHGRPAKVERLWSPVPAVVSRAGPAAPQHPQMEAELLPQLEAERNLSARLEAELRQLRSRNTTGEAKATAGKEGDDDSLDKLKGELQRTKVDINALGRKASFEDVIGLEKAKRALHEAVIWPLLADPALFAGVRGGVRGLLLYGPPGCGKTMLARAAAAELGEHASFFHVRPGDVMSKFYGDSQRRVQALEALVKEASPAVVFLDEVDSLLGSRDGSGVAEHHRATTNALLEWMDGFNTGLERVFFLGATNRGESIDEAALRRFGEAAEVELPSLEARLSLITHLVTSAAGDGHRSELQKCDLHIIAERTEGFSLADVDGLVQQAFLAVLRELPGGVKPGMRPADVPPVKFAHFDGALQDTSGTSALKQMLKARAEKRSL